jgi:manganese/zinc/iron transport system ATP- binding protein
MSSVCEISQLTVNYEQASALWDVSVQLPANQLIAICGPNGAGKSTFLKALLGLVPISSGAISFEKNLAIGYMPQRQNIDWDFPITVLELVLMGSYGRVGLFSRISKDEKKKAFSALEKVGLNELAHRQISELSGGQQGRAFLARALMQEADIYFLDEPFAGIDVVSTQVIASILQELKDQGKTVVVVHHDLKFIQQLFDWGVLLNRRLVDAGPICQVLCEKNIQLAFGKENLLFDEATALSKKTIEGFAT